MHVITRHACTVPCDQSTRSSYTSTTSSITSTTSSITLCSVKLGKSKYAVELLVRHGSPQRSRPSRLTRASEAATQARLPKTPTKKQKSTGAPSGVPRQTHETNASRPAFYGYIFVYPVARLATSTVQASRSCLRGLIIRGLRPRSTLSAQLSSTVAQRGTHATVLDRMLADLLGERARDRIDHAP